MALPKLITPHFKLTLPSSGEKIEYRPFLVAEEKILLTAMESNTDEDMILALKQLIKNCIISDIETEKLPIFDMEYIFTQLRAKSISNIIILNAKMKGCKEESCPKTVKFELDLHDLEIKRDENHTTKIELTATDGIVLKYPSLSLLSTYNDAKDSVDSMYKMIIDCIDYIYDAETTYSSNDHTESELMEYLNILSHKQFEDITNFFKTMPSIQKTFEVTCPKCNKKETVVVSGLNSFFG